MAEVEAPGDVKFVEPFQVFISQEGKTYYFILENLLFRSQVKVVKVDAETGRPILLAGTTFKIRDLATGDWVTQYINYPTPTDISEFLSAADGTLVLPEPLKSGEYELVKVVAPRGYLLSKEPVKFTVHSSNGQETVTVTMENKPVMGKITVEKTGNMLTGAKEIETIFGKQYLPIFEMGYLVGAEFDVIAAADIVTPDGTVRAKKGDVVDHIVTGDGGAAASKEQYSSGLPQYQTKQWQHNSRNGRQECYGLRYADDFRIFCRTRADAEKLFVATTLWLKERLSLDISPEKSRIINLKRQYSDFLGFKMMVKPKGAHRGKPQYTVVSHIADKRTEKIKQRSKALVKAIQFPANTKEEHKFIMDYNSYVIGVHNYYRIATHISYDFARIGFPVKRTMKNRLGKRMKKSGPSLPPYMAKQYSASRELRYIHGIPLIPIAYVQTRPPLFRARNSCVYTPEGRGKIHKNLQAINVTMLRYLMENPVPDESVEFNDNRLSLYCAQQGKCAVTGQLLGIGNIVCHHRQRKADGGTDAYVNLALISTDVHILIHAMQETTIQKYLASLNLKHDQLDTLNRLRQRAGNEPISIK